MITGFKRILTVLVILLINLLSINGVNAESLFDATGTWSVVIERAELFNLCLEYDKETEFDVVIIQNEDEFIYNYDGNEFAGSIVGPDYKIEIEYEDNNGITKENIKFSLSSKELGAGSGTWVWNADEDNNFGIGHCEGYEQYYLTKKNESTIPKKDSGGGDDEFYEVCFIGTVLFGLK